MTDAKSLPEARTVRRASASRGPTTTVFVAGSLPIAYAALPVETPSPRRWPGREPPETPMGAEGRPLLVDDPPFLSGETLASKEVPVVAAAQEARLLALGPARHGQARTLGLVPGLGLRLVAEREPDPLEVLRVEPGEHVRLILLRIAGAREQEPPAVLDDPCVVARRQPRCASAAREGEQLAEPEASIAARARVRRLASCVAVHEVLDDRAPELLARVERDVRDPEPVARLSRRDHGFWRAAGALRRGRLGIDPEPKRHPDRRRTGSQERDCAVHPSAHRDGRAFPNRARTEDRADRVRERVHDESLPGDRRGLEQGQADERLLQPLGVSVDDAIAVDDQAYARPFVSTR